MWTSYEHPTYHLHTLCVHLTINSSVAYGHRTTASPLIVCSVPKKALGELQDTPVLSLRCSHMSLHQPGQLKTCSICKGQTLVQVHVTTASASSSVGLHSVWGVFSTYRIVAQMVSGGGCASCTPPNEVVENTNQNELRTLSRAKSSRTS